jgi:hypothetical protein
VASDAFAPVSLVGRAELRRRWTTIVFVGLLFGLVAGAALACLAGARRTSSVFERHLVASNASEIDIDPGDVNPEVDAALRSLPHVTGGGYWLVYSAFPLTSDHKVDESMAGLISFTTDTRYIDTDRLVTSAGRLLDPSNPHEVMINQSMADFFDLGVGSTLELGIITSDDDGNPSTMEPEPADRLDVTVSGIMVLNEEITSEDIDTVPRMFVSPAARKPMDPPGYYGFAWYGLQVEGGPDAIEEVQAAWQELADAHNDGIGEGEDGWLSYIHNTSDLELKASRAVRPLVTTLAAFGVLVLLASILLAGQALGRQVRSRRSEAGITRVLGLTPAQALAASMYVPVASLGVGLMATVATFLAISPLFPVGPFEVLEPSPGLHVDFVVLGIGVLASVVIPLALVLLTAWREIRGAALTLGDGGGKVGLLARAGGRTGRSPAMSAAIRLTFDPGRGRRFVPTRSVLVSLTITIAALVTVVVFGSNLTSLDNDPARFGWPADGLVASDGGYGPFDKAVLATVLDSSPEVASWRYVAAGRVLVEGERVPSALFGEGDPTLVPTIVDGRGPKQSGEIVLGAGTSKRVNASIGDTVTVGGGDTASEMRVTGIAVFPVLGPVLATRTGLDQGAWIDEADYKQIDAVSAFIAYGLPDEPQFSLALFKLAPGGSLDRLNETMQATEGVSLGSSVDMIDVISPSEVRTAASGGGRTQTLLCAVIAVAAAMSMVLALAAVVRRRRSELAVYRVLGFEPRQVRATVLWQGVLMAAVALVIGVPAGSLLGSVLWRAFANRLGVIPDPTLPVTRLLIAIGLTLVVSLAGAAGPAVMAARVSPAEGLRSE